MQICEVLSFISAIIWLVILFLPWKPYLTKEVLEADTSEKEPDLSDVTVLIPARNEAQVIKKTMSFLKDQGKGLKIILVDDESEDGTAERAKEAGIAELYILKGKPLPAGWAGKIWALDQGFKLVKTPYLLIMDADIFLKKGTILSLKKKLLSDEYDLVSLMAVLSMKRFWEKMLISSFVYFFKLLYPFSLCNKKDLPFAAAAGGCMFTKREVIQKIGGFKSIKDEIIDDCALAKKIKQNGYSTWIGLTHSVISGREYAGLSDIWNMVARSAFTQLNYSFLLLALCTIALISSFVFPFLGMISGSLTGVLITFLALSAMILTYIPVLNFYGINKLWALTFPIAGLLYLMMTWSSAFRYISGKRSIWKGRVYSVHNIPE
jgi:hopene-associated glycosyltransferase HpnB